MFLWLVILLFVFNLLWSSDRKEFVGQHSGSALFTRRVHSSWLVLDGLRAFAGFTGLAFYHLRFRVLEWCCALQSSSLSFPWPSHVTMSGFRSGLEQWLKKLKRSVWDGLGLASLRFFDTPTMIPTPSSNYNLQCTDPPNSFRGTSNLFNYKQTRDSYNNRELSPKS